MLNMIEAPYESQARSVEYSEHVEEGRGSRIRSLMTENEKNDNIQIQLDGETINGLKTADDAQSVTSLNSLNVLASQGSR